MRLKMVKMSVLYEGELHTVVTHLPTGNRLHTDVSKDSVRQGKNFSPTDLVSGALASCMATMLGVFAQKKGWDVRGLRIVVDKVLSEDISQRIIALPVEIWMPTAIPETEKTKVERVVISCPVHQSLNSEIKIPLTIHWK